MSIQTHPVAMAPRKPPPVDANAKERPGVPMEFDPPHPLGARQWTVPERQSDPGYILKREDLVGLTPVFGTACPPRGLSGAIRRTAYRIPEYKTAHWLLLMFADRVDVIEHGSPRAVTLALPLLVGGGLAVYALRRRRS